MNGPIAGRRSPPVLRYLIRTRSPGCISDGASFSRVYIDFIYCSAYAASLTANCSFISSCRVLKNVMSDSGSSTRMSWSSSNVTFS